MTPKEMNCYIPYAQGNVTSCDVQGFFALLGYGMKLKMKPRSQLKALQYRVDEVILGKILSDELR